MMRGVDYERIVDARRGAKSAKEAQEAEDKLDKEEGLEEIQLTTDGEEFYEYVRAPNTAGILELSPSRRHRAVKLSGVGSESATPVHHL